MRDRFIDMLWDTLAGSLTRGFLLLAPLIGLMLPAATLPSSAAAEAAVSARNIPAVLAERGKNLSALKAVMAVSTSYDKDNSRQDVRGFLLYRRPSDFRFQGLGPGGNSLFEMIVKATKFELYVPAESKILKGGRNCFFERFPDVAELETLIPLALLQWQNATITGVIAEDSSKIVVSLRFGNQNWRATLSPPKLLLLRLEKIGPKSVELVSNFSEFADGEYGWLPRRFDVRSHAGGWRTLVRINQIETNPFLVEKNFELETAFSPKTEDCK